MLTKKNSAAPEARRRRWIVLAGAQSIAFITGTSRCHDARNYTIVGDPAVRGAVEIATPKEVQHEN